MAIAQTATKTQGYSQANPVTMTFDCAGGDLLVLGLGVYAVDRTGGAPTYDGVPMTASPEGQVRHIADQSGVEMWYLVSPAAGNNVISIPNTGTRFLTPTASAWSGVDTVDPFDTSNSGSALSANPSVAVTTAAANELIIDVMMDMHNDAPTGNSHTLIFSVDQGSWSDNAQYTLDDGTAGVTFTWTVPSDHWSMIVCAFNPLGVEPPTRRVFLIF